MLLRFSWALALLGALVLGAAVLWLRFAPTAAAPGASPTRGAPSLAPAPPPVSTPSFAECQAPAAMLAAASANAASLETALWSPSGGVEQGWSAYAPLAAREVGTGCPAESPAFAAALGRRQTAAGAPATGVMDEPTLKAMVNTWLLRRPFVQATRRGECPPAPDPARLAVALPGETLGGKAVQATPGALEAWRRMKLAARAEAPEIAADPRVMAIASGFRGPDEEAARCAEGGCGTLARARCSAHRTGTAFDLVLSTDPGVQPMSTEEANRKALARTPAYRWLAANADRFGFLPYPYEPWHWEWAGEVNPAPALR